MTTESLNSGERDTPALLLTVPEACAVLKISRGQLYQLMHARKLETVKIGRSRRIPETAVKELIQRLRAEGAH
jgi:excisionase family DNA binding protein